jgi:hypothetical protein
MEPGYARGNLFGIARDAAGAAGAAGAGAGARAHAPAGRGGGGGGGGGFLSAPAFSARFVRERHAFFDLIAPLFVCLFLALTVQRLSEDAAQLRGDAVGFGPRLRLFLGRHALFFVVCGGVALLSFALFLLWFLRSEEPYRDSALFAAPRLAMCVIAGTLPILVSAAFVAGLSSGGPAPRGLGDGVYGTVSALVVLQIALFAVPFVRERLQKE